MKKKLKRLSTVAVARLVRLFDSCCMVAPGITGIIIGLFLSVPMALCLSWLLNILNPFQVPTLQESHESSYDCAIHLIGFFGGLVAGLWTVLNWWRAQNLGRWLRKTFFPNSQDH